MTPTTRVAFGLALAAGSALATQAYPTQAAAQVVTRQITSEPVETVVSQGPNGTVVTQRILPSDPGLVPYPSRPLPYPPGVVAPPGIVGVGPIETDVAPSVVAGPAPVIGQAPVVTRRVVSHRVIHHEPVHAHTVARVVRERPSTVGLAPPPPPASVPLVLSAPQRQVIYRTIVQQAVYPAAPVAAPVLPGPPPVADYPPPAVYPAGADYADYVGQPYAYASAPYYQPGWRRPYYWDGVALVPGARLPPSIRISPVPPVVAAEYPDVAPYSYAYVDDRVYLVDPATFIIMAELTR